MKNQPIILTGPAGSGKTYTAKLMAELFNEENVLIKNINVLTKIGLIRRINKRKIKLLILDECADIKTIEDLNDSLYYASSTIKDFDDLRVIYITQQNLIFSQGFKVIKCNYNLNQA